MTFLSAPHLILAITFKRLKAFKVFFLMFPRIKLFLTTSSIDFSDICETSSYFVLPPWCIKPPQIVLDLMHLKKDRTDASVYKQLFMAIGNRYRDYIPVFTDGSRGGSSVACASLSI